MSQGARIICTPDRGTPVEGYLASGETIYPGMIVQEDPTQPLIGNTVAWKIYNRDADGNRPAGPFIVVREDILQGKTMSDAYATGAGTRLFGFIPKAGCRLNLLYKNETGTADDVTAGDIFIVDDGTGKVTLTASTPETEVAMAREALVDPTADALVYSIWTGY